MWIRGSNINSGKSEGISILDEHGYSGKYQIEQCQVSELAEKGKSADFAIATTVVGANMPCPVLPGLPLLTGVGADKLFSDVEEQMNK